jgi:hypothetical protein
MVDVHIGTNRKLRRLTIPERWCFVAGVLPIAAQAPVRGRLLVGTELATEGDYAETAGVSLSVACSAVEKLRSCGVIEADEEFECERIHDWEDCNPGPKHDGTAADRMRRYRERMRLRNGTSSVTDVTGVTNAPVTGVTNAPVTPGREEKRREVNAEASFRSSAARIDRERDKASAEDLANCRLFAQLAQQRNAKVRIPKADTGEWAKWLSSMRLCRERDSNSADEIERLIRWVFTDPSSDAMFWGSTIQAPSGFREHFGQMWSKMSAASGLRAVPVVESSDDYLRRRGVVA